MFLGAGIHSPPPPTYRPSCGAERCGGGGCFKQKYVSLMKKTTGLDRYTELLLGTVFIILSVICALITNNTILQFIPHWWYFLAGGFCWEFFMIFGKVGVKLWFPFLRDDDDDS